MRQSFKWISIVPCETLITVDLRAGREAISIWETKVRRKEYKRYLRVLKRKSAITLQFLSTLWLSCFHLDTCSFQWIWKHCCIGRLIHNTNPLVSQMLCNVAQALIIVLQQLAVVLSSNCNGHSVSGTFYTFLQLLKSTCGSFFICLDYQQIAS